MTDADFENESPNVVLPGAIRFGAFLVGGIGSIALTVAGLWWAYATVRAGVTYQELGEFGAGLLAVAFFAYMCAMIIEDDSEDATQKLFAGDENER